MSSQRERKGINYYTFKTDNNEGILIKIQSYKDKELFSCGLIFFFIALYSLVPLFQL